MQGEAGRAARFPESLLTPHSSPAVNRQRACRSQEQRRARLRQPRGGSSGRLETNRAQRPVGIAASAQRRFT